jgi:hypothetical protein
MEMLMENLYKTTLRKFILESLEDSEAKYQKDIRRIQSVAETVVVNKNRFEVEFYRYFLKQTGKNIEQEIKKYPNGDYLDRNSKEIGKYFIAYITNLLGGSVSNVEVSQVKHGEAFGLTLKTELKMSFVKFDVKSYLKLVPDKEHLFNIDTDDSTLYLTPKETEDKSFKIPNEPKSYDILTYKESSYKADELKTAREDFKQEYADAYTEDFIEESWEDLIAEKGDPKNESELKDLTSYFLKSLLKHFNLIHKSTIYFGHLYAGVYRTMIDTELGPFKVYVNFSNGIKIKSYIDSVELAHPEGRPDDIILYRV